MSGSTMSNLTDLFLHIRLGGIDISDIHARQPTSSIKPPTLGCSGSEQ